MENSFAHHGVLGMKWGVRRYQNKYKEPAANPKKPSRGKDFVMDVLEKSGKNIATQLTTYAMGAAVNKVAGKEIVNPKKGQKDK